MAAQGSTKQANTTTALDDSDEDDELAELLAEGQRCHDQAMAAAKRGTKRPRSPEAQQVEECGTAPGPAKRQAGTPALPTVRAAGLSIACTLQECNKEAVIKSVSMLGVQLALDVLEEVQRVEEGGGMMVPSGNRRRSAGGVYFHLLKSHLTPAQLKTVFQHNKELFKEKILAKNRRRNARRRQAVAPSAPRPPPAPAATPSWMAPSQPSTAPAVPSWMAPSNPPPPPAPAAPPCTPGSTESAPVADEGAARAARLSELEAVLAMDF